MPLPPAVTRKELHCRSIEMRGYEREDGLFDIEGRITDVKTASFQPKGGRHVEANTPVHSMSIRLTIGEDMVIREVHAVTDLSPFPECPDAAPAIGILKGVSMSKGWRAAISDKLGGPRGCTHIRELLNTLGSSAHQSLGLLRKSRPPVIFAPGKIPPLVDTCWAYSAEREQVTRRWPEIFPPKAG